MNPSKLCQEINFMEVRSQGHNSRYLNFTVWTTVFGTFKLVSYILHKSTYKNDELKFQDNSMLCH